MTREERENALHCLKVMIDEEVCEECNLYGATGTDHCEKDCVRVAIKALEQEPCEDAVSRDVVKEQMIMYGFHAPDMTVTEFVEDLPSVNPKEPITKNDLGVDCISRADVLQILLDYDYANENALVLKDIKELPSVTPQEPTIKALGEELRKVRKGIADEKVLIGYNLAVAICNKHLGGNEVEE